MKENTDFTEIGMEQGILFEPEEWKKPKVFMPGNGVSITESCNELAIAYSRKEDPADRLYSFHGAVSFIRNEDPENLSVGTLTSVQACSEFEQVADIMVREKCRDQSYANCPAICTRQFADMILNSREFLGLLPKLTMVTRFPVLYSGQDGIRVIDTYDSESGIFASSRSLEELPLNTALEILKSIFCDFDFETPGDRSRAFAALITPALVFGRFLQDRIPVTMIMADKSQAGKGFLANVICAVYGEVPGLVTLRRSGGVGGFDETFDAVLRTGRPFILMDNLRGNLNSTQLEAFVTGENYQTRIAYQGYEQVNPHDYFLMATSNGLVMTEDIANRCSFVRIRKRATDYNYQEYPEGDLLSHLRANPMRYLSAVYAVIQAWMKRGKPLEDGKQHSFRGWAAVWDGIVRNVMEEAPLMLENAEHKLAILCPDIEWLRSVYQKIVEDNRVNEELFAQDIVEICVKYNIPCRRGRISSYPTMSEKQRKQVCSLVSKQLNSIFAILDAELQLDCNTFLVTRGRKTRKFETSSTTAVFYKFSSK